MRLAARVVLTCCVFAAAETQLPITFANRQPFPVDLLWADGVNDPVLMSSIDPGEEISMNSYAGHQFLARQPVETAVLVVAWPHLPCSPDGSRWVRAALHAPGERQRH